MRGQKEEDAAVYRDADRLGDIVDQINRMLYEKEQQLKEVASGTLVRPSSPDFQQR